MTEADPDTPTTLDEALLALQRDLPKIGLDRQADMETYGTHRYAGLDKVNETLLPLMNSLGLTWSCMPGMLGDQFGLHFTLRHVPSKEQHDGFWPIVVTKPQQQGSMITYARRYAILAVTGVAPHGDDDDANRAQHDLPENGEVSGQPSGEEDQRSEEDKATEWIQYTVDQALGGTDLELLNRRLKRLEAGSVLADRDVSHLITSPERKRLGAQPDTPFSLLALVSLAVEHIGRTQRAVRAANGGPDEAQAQGALDDIRDRGSS